MPTTRATGRARGRAAPAISAAALLLSMLTIAMLAGTAFAQSPDPSASVDPAATESPIASPAETSAASPGETSAASPAASLPDTASGDPRPGMDEPTSNIPMVVGLIGLVAAIVLTIGFLGARSRQAERGHEDDIRQ